MRYGEYLLPLLLVLVQFSFAKKCDCEGFYCVSEIEYEFCVNGEVVGDRFRCLPGSVCRSKERQCSPHSVCQEINDCFTEGIFPDLTSIYKFYTCVLDLDNYNWNKREYTCPDGSYFVSSLGGCLKEERSGEKLPIGHNSPISVKEWISPKTASSDSALKNNDEKKNENILKFTSGIVFTDISQRADILNYEKEKSTQTESAIEQNQPSNIEFICLDDGFFPDPENCQRYFVCDGSSIGVQKKCLNGTYFDTENSICTEKMPKRCKTPQTPIDSKETAEEEFVCPGEGYYPDPQDCQRFYMCDEWGSFFHISCPESTYFETKFQDCVYDKPERCRSLSSNLSENSTQSSSTESTAYKNDEFTEKSIDDDKIYTAKIPADKNYTDFFDGTLRTLKKQKGNVKGGIDLTSENIFAINGTKKLLTTDSGASKKSSTDIRTATTKWNDTRDEVTSITTARYTEISEFTPDNKIPTTATTEEDEEPPWSYTIGNIFSTSKVTAGDGAEGEFVCPGDGYYADLKNCKKYYICFSETPPISISCPDGLYYDENLICSKERPDRCQTSETSTDSHISTTSGYNDNEKEAEFKCSGEGYYPDPKSCHSYYLCNEWNNAIQIECPNNTFYDADIEFCTEVVPKRCVNSETYSNDNIYQSSVEFDAEEGTDFVCSDEGLLPDPTNCQRYYVCYRHDMNSPLQHGRPILCPENTYFDDNSIQCISKMPERCNMLDTTEDHVIQSTTTISTPKDDREKYQCPGEGYFPDYENCTRFFICYDWAPGFSASCPHNTYFDEIKGFCTQEKPERCRATENPSFTINTSTPRKNGIDQFSSTTVSSPKEFRCPREGYFPDPENCHRYYACYGFGSAMLITCPDDTYFDNESVFCTLDVPERCRPSTKPPSSSTPEPLEDEHDVEFACPGAGTFADPKNCRKYWICYNSDFGFPNTCHENTYFHNDIKNCLSEVPPSCKNSGSERHDTAKKIIQDQDYDIKENGKNDDDVNDNKGNEDDAGDDDDIFEDHKKDEFICPHAGYFPDSTNCQKYYICYSWESKFSVECPKNSYYHNRKLGCTSDLPERCQKKNVDENKFVCPGVGYFPDPNDCRRYYVCDFRNDLYPVTCPENRYFHANIRGCSEEIPYTCFKQSWYQNKSNPDEFTCSGVGYFPDPKNCSLYHICNSETRALTEYCPSTMYYDEDISSCTSRLPKRCRNLEYDKFRAQVTTVQTTPDYKISTTSKPERFICPGHGIFPDPKDCQKFYLCYGRPRQVKCYSGFYFNAETKRCDNNVPERCKEKRVSAQNPLSALTEKASNTEEPENFVCPNEGIFPDPEDCQSFYICYGHPRRSKCQSGLYFNAETKRCVKEMQSRCLNSAKISIAEPASLLTTDEQEFQCPGRGVFADPKDCRYFYVCYGFTKKVACRSGTFFSEETKFCDFTMPSNCFNNTSATSTPYYPHSTEYVQADFRCQKQGRFADPKNCRRYYVCTWQLESTLFTCPYSTFFNDYTKECKREIPDRCWDNATQTTTTPPSSFVCRKRGYFPDPKNCQSFYHCEDDTAEPVLYNCPKNKFFNKEKGKCKKPKNGFNYCQYARPKPASRNESSSVESEEGDRASTSFSCIYPGLYPDPHNCKKYYECTSNLEAIHKTCFGETNFSEILHSCTYFTSQNCRKSNF